MATQNGCSSATCTFFEKAAKSLIYTGKRQDHKRLRPLMTGLLICILDEWIRGLLMWRPWARHSWVQHARASRWRLAAGAEPHQSMGSPT